MNNPYQKDQLFSAIRKILGDILDRNPEEISGDASMFNDLGADSLDFVEFRYTVEQELGIVLAEKSVLDHLAAVVGDDQVYHKGHLTPLAAEVLRRSFFRYGADQVQAGMRPYDVMEATTARNWAAYCHALFDHLPARCADCDSHEAKLSPAGKAVCAGCGAVLKPKTGDKALADVMPRLAKACASVDQAA